MVLIGGFSQRQALQFEVYQKRKMDKFRKGCLASTLKGDIAKQDCHQRLKNLLETMHLQKWSEEAVTFDVKCAPDLSREWLLLAPANTAIDTL